MIRVLVADDHPIVREGLSFVLSDDPDFTVVGQADTAESALTETDRLRPDVVLIDLRLPGMNGTETCAELTKRHPKLGVIVLSSHPNQGAIATAFSSGAKGIVLKESEPAVYRQAVRAVAHGETYTDQRIAHRFVSLASQKRRVKGPFGLSMQEMRVLELLPRGFTNKEIGRELGVTEDTVKSHVRGVLRKLNARDRAEAASIAIRNGLA